MPRLLMLVRYDVSLVLTLVENPICTSTEEYLSSLSARPYLYCQKFKRMPCLLSLVQYDVSLVLTFVKNLICTSTEEYLSSLSARPHLHC